MEKKITAQQLFAKIKEDLFKDIDIEKLILGCKNEDDTRKLMVEQIERLLEKDDTGRNAPIGTNAAYMSDYFYTADEGRKPIGGYQPFLDPEERMNMNEDEKELCSFYLTMAGLCHDLYNNFLFSLDLIKPGIETGEDWIYDFQITNKRLVVYLETTPYRFIAAHISHIMINENLNLIIGTNDALQDFLANESYSYRDFTSGHISPDEYIDKALGKMNEWLKHDLEAERLNLSDDQLAVHDQLFGTVMPGKFKKEYVDAAKTLAKYFNKPPRIGIQAKQYVSDFVKLARKYNAETPLGLEDLNYEYLASYATYVYNSNFGSNDDDDDFDDDLDF